MTKKRVVAQVEEDPVQIEYKRILTAAIIKNGSLVKTNESILGWHADDDYDGDRWSGPRHSKTCGIAKTGRIEEDATWYEFAGTFATNHNYMHGMQLHGVTCNCGKLKDRVIRWDASVGEAIRIVMMELLEEKVKGVVPE